STGDGGSGGDPDGDGQNLNALLGKILRVDVNGAAPYAIPASNPFANRSGARPEIWAYGLRNPWRYSFDRSTGDLWIADVGQNKYEEVDFQPAASKGGENYGWRTMEGAHCYRPSNGCSQEGLVLPVFEYTHDEGCSVTGGYVYRGKAIPALTGRYLFADYCGSTLWGTTRSASGEFATSELGTVPEGISSFGEDEAGEVYFTVDDGGAVYRLTAK
ncbi:MAG TPA: PQQ-dependent sugar dehydrogenase, partial [Tepidiformaceae bacterium]|nr:PQQ-dependent sugar dehydrogenase [Tepidiformaceae bacterium]